MADNVADVVVATASCSSCDLFEISDRKNAGAFSIIFTQLGEDDCSDGNVDSHAQGVGAANDFE